MTDFYYWLYQHVKSMQRPFVGLLMFALLSPSLVKASELISISPASDRMLLVYIEDGFIDTYGAYQGVSSHKTYHDPSDIKQLMTLSNYSISSSDDSNFSSGKSPINVGRKSKAVHYNDEWSSVPFVFGHWVYIELPHALQEGKTYEIEVDNIVDGNTTVKFEFDSKKVRSETVHVNMVGFAPESPKYGYLSQWMGDFNTSTHPNGGLNLDQYAGRNFYVVNYNTGAVAYTGTVALRMRKDVVETGSSDFAPSYNYSNADVYECDFSSFSSQGEYVLAVEGLGCSYPFEIGGSATKAPFYYAMKGLFWSRQGVGKEMTDGSIMPRDHHYDDITWLWDKNHLPGDNHSNEGFDDANAVQVSGIYGYYHDAGDWDGYIHHAKVPMALLMLYDAAPDKFYDGEIGNKYRLSDSSPWIDEGSNGLPDLLDEAVWLIDYYKRSKNILKNQYGGTGGVPGYVGRDGVPGNNFTAWQDTRDWYLSGESAWQTYHYAGLAAYYATCLNKFHKLTNSGNHPDYNSWRQEAIDAYAWAEAHPQDTDLSKNSNQEYRVKGFAAAALYRLTGTAKYQTDLKTYLDWEPWAEGGEWSNQNIIDVCHIIVSMIPDGHPNLDASLKSNSRSEVIRKADTYKVKHNQDNAFRTGVEYSQFMQLGGLNTPRLTMVPFAYLHTGDKKYLDVVNNSMNYVLGGNQLNQTYISGLGEFSDQWIFNPNGWIGNDQNSMVYPSRPNIGYTSYFSATSYWFTQSIASEFWSRKGTYPNLINNPGSWPGAEQTFRNMFSIQGGEFTVHQQNNYMIYASGFQKAMDASAVGTYRIASAPTVSLNFSNDDQVNMSEVELSVNASSKTRTVRYFYDWHFIGESNDKANNFKLTWDPPVANGTEVLLTAVAIDEEGQWSKPSSAGEKRLTVVAGPGDDTTPPSVPTNLSASDLRPFDFNLSWNASSDASGVKNYEVYKDGKLLKKTVELEFFIEKLDPSTNYEMQVLARDKEGNVSAKSPVFTVRTLDVPLGDGKIHQQSNDADGLMEAEAEDFSYRADGTSGFEKKFWYEHEDPQASDGVFMMVQDNGNRNSAGTLNGPRMDFIVNFTKTGAHYVWLRVKPDHGADNSVVLAFEDENRGDWSLGDNPDWIWVKADSTIQVPTTGQQTFSVFMREDGTKVDKVLLTSNPDYDPSGSTPTPPPAENTATFVVDSSSDDAEEKAGVMNLTSNDLDLRAGEVSAVRFRVSIPEGSVITKAELILESKGNYSGSNEVAISVQQSADPATFTTGAQDISNRTLSAETVSWSLGDWAQDQQYTSPDLVSLINLAVDAGWTSDQHIVFQLEANTASTKSAKTYDFNNSTNGAPQLKITYQEASVPPTVSITSPSEGVNFDVGENITIQTQTGGDVQLVSFFRVTDGVWNFLGNDQTAPFSWSANDFPAGDHQITVSATGNDGNSSPYVSVNISVGDTGGSDVYTQQSDGLAVFEAEGFHRSEYGVGQFASMQWESQTDAQASGGNFMIVPDNANSISTGALEGPVVHYDVDFVKTGTHYFWVRQKSPNGSDNSITPAFEGTKINEWNMPDALTEWTWSRLGTTFNVAQTGVQTFSIYMREDGTPIDKIILTDNVNYAPTGTGPDNARVIWEAEGTEAGIYPNPARGTVHIDPKDESYQKMVVTDLTGRVVLTQTSIKAKTSIELPAGVYIINLIGETKAISEQIIVY